MPLEVVQLGERRWVEHLCASLCRKILLSWNSQRNQAIPLPSSIFLCQGNSRSFWVSGASKTGQIMLPGTVFTLRVEGFPAVVWFCFFNYVFFPCNIVILLPVRIEISCSFYINFIKKIDFWNLIFLCFWSQQLQREQFFGQKIIETLICIPFNHSL